VCELELEEAVKLRDLNLMLDARLLAISHTSRIIANFVLKYQNAGLLAIAPIPTKLWLRQEMYDE